MNTSELVYEGELRTRATHMHSGTQIFTDAPLDNHGKAQSFSPTDLVATALGCCMMTIMGIEANKQQINLEGTKISVVKFMTSNPRRISKIEVKLEIPERSLTEEQKITLENLAKSCPVAKSISTEIDQDITFIYV